MPDVQIYAGKKVAAPSTYELPASAEFVLKCVNADFDGSGAAGDYLPCVTIVSDAGQVIARAVDQGVKVTAGSDAEVSWFPRLKRKVVAATSQSCQLLGSGNGNTTLTLTLTKAVPAKGVLHVVFGQASVPDGIDAGSEPTGVVDSGGIVPWRIPSSPNATPLIGNIRQDDPGNAFSIQVGSCDRACTTADLGVGSTITVTFSSVAPANFHSTGLVIWQPAYLLAVKQGALTVYNNGDAHPDFDPSMTRLSYFDDFGVLGPKPAQDAVMLTAMGAYPPVAGFSPFVGSRIGEITSGSLSVAASCAAVCEGVIVDPGGTWPAGAQALVGNYQFAQPRVCLTV